MSELEIIKEIDLDFLIKKAVFVDAKQGDRNSRYILVSCYSNGSFVSLNPEKHTAFIRYRKKDECISFNKCQITEEGKILVELTQQMLAFPGNCIADLLVMKITKENEDNCESSTMQFYVNVVAMPYNDSDIESTDEFKALSDLMDKALKDYTYVMEHAQESADKAETEATKATNAAAKAQESQNAAANSATASANSANDSASSATASAASAAEALASQNAAKESETAAANSAQAAATSETNAGQSATAAKTSETNAGKSSIEAAASATAAAESATESAESAENASASETNAGESATAAANSEKNAKTAEMNATTQATNAKNSATNADASASTAMTKANEAAQSATDAASSAETATSQATSASNSASTATTQANAAKTSATSAADSAKLAQSYTKGNTGLRPNEASDSAEYYYNQSKSISESFSGALRPMGTVEFSDLPAIDSVTGGNMYNISDDFNTTDDFMEGKGHSYPAGTNVYKTASGKWDCLAGTPVNTVNGRRGDVIIDKTDVGLENVDNTADKDKNVKSATTANKVAYALTFTGGVSESYDGGAAKSVAIPTTLPADGGNADTVDNYHIQLISETDYQNLITKDVHTIYCRYK